MPPSDISFIPTSKDCKTWPWNLLALLMALPRLDFHRSCIFWFFNKKLGSLAKKACLCTFNSVHVTVITFISWEMKNDPSWVKPQKKAVGYAGNLRCVQHVSSADPLALDEDHHPFVAWSKALPGKERSEAAAFVVVVFIFNVSLNIQGSFVFLSWEKLLWKGSLDPLCFKMGQCWQK